jgi:hypothetical protein
VTQYIFIPRRAPTQHALRSLLLQLTFLSHWHTAD